MRDLDDFDLRPGDAGVARRGPAFDDAGLDRLASDEQAADVSSSAWDESGHQTVQRPGPRPNRAAGLIVALIVAAGLVAAFWLMSRRVEPPPPGTVAEPETKAENAAAANDEPRGSTELEAPLPPLDQSDALVRQLVGGLSSLPALRAWIATPRLIRTFTAAVENASLGGSPSANLRFLQPRQPYPAIERPGRNGNELVPDPAGYRRYDTVVQVFTSIDPQATAEVYRRLRGLIQEAFAELGYPDQSFDSALAAAFETVLATPIPDTAPILERNVSSYRYADPRLEELAPIQKHLLRMGPDHARSVKAQIRALANELELGLD